MGTAPFAVPALEAVAEHVCLVVSQPDRKSGRGLKLQPSPVKAKALELNLPIETPEKCRVPEFVEKLRSLNADVLLVAAYGQILSTQVLESTKYGGINLHGSILPEYRGAAPIQRAIEDGLKETGVTLMQMDKGMDTGDIIAIEKCPIDPDGTSLDLAIKLSDLAAKMSKEWMPKICEGSYPRTPQDDNKATYAAKLTKEEAELDLEKDAQSQYNKFRAFTPNPASFINTRFGYIKLTKALYDPIQHDAKPGEIIESKDHLVIAFKKNALKLVEVQPAGKKRVSGRDFANGTHLKPGDNIL